MLCVTWQNEKVGSFWLTLWSVWPWVETHGQKYATIKWCLIECEKLTQVRRKHFWNLFKDPDLAKCMSE